jgi:hypothetical protein
VEIMVKPQHKNLPLEQQILKLGELLGKLESDVSVKNLGNPKYMELDTDYVNLFDYVIRSRIKLTTEQEASLGHLSERYETWAGKLNELQNQRIDYYRKTGKIGNREPNSENNGNGDSKRNRDSNKYKSDYVRTEFHEPGIGFRRAGFNVDD